MKNILRFSLILATALHIVPAFAGCEDPAPAARPVDYLANIKKLLDKDCLGAPADAQRKWLATAFSPADITINENDGITRITAVKRTEKGVRPEFTLSLRRAIRDGEDRIFLSARFPQEAGITVDTIGTVWNLSSVKSLPMSPAGRGVRNNAFVVAGSPQQKITALTYPDGNVEHFNYEDLNVNKP